jgi:hypothetical protein
MIGEGLWTRILLVRRVVKAIDELVVLHRRQTEALERIADRVAPILVETSPADLKQTTADFVDYSTQGRIQDYVERVVQDSGREPTEEEIMAYLEGQEQRL